MKKKCLFGLSLIALLSLAGCTSTSKSGTEDIGGDYSYNDPITVEDPEDIDIEENTGEFSITTSEGAYTNSGNIYRLTKGGTYSLSGKLSGQILVEAGEDDEVVLELKNASIDYDQDSPIKILSADKVEISAKSDTGNTITDKRNAKTTDVLDQGEGAIYAKSDLKFKGTGILVVTGNYNNGVHTTKNLTIQKLTLKVVGNNNALKGNDGVTITSGTVQAYAKTGNGIKTENTDVSSKGNQRGTVAINGGYVYVDSLHDAIDASYNVEINQLDSEVSTEISIKTGTNSTYYSKTTFKADSEKGVKAQNDIIVNDGTMVIAASDDAVHANYGIALDNGSKGTGNITITGGAIQVASGDDGLHADNTLTISGGRVVVTGATEGFEGNYINISGGSSYIYGTDDGVNCSKKSFKTCAFTMSGGYLDVAVKSGDTDGIDSNGDVTISGGVIVSRGSPGTTQSHMSTGLDVDGTCSMTGGTLIAFNGLEKTPSKSSSILYAGTSNANSSSGGGPGGGGGGPGGGGGHWSYNASTTYTFQNGKYRLVGTNIDISFTNDYTYGSFQIHSASLSTGATYELFRNDEQVLSWSQTSSSVTIS